MEYLFISYSEVDEVIAKRLVDQLESAGFKTWLAEKKREDGEQLPRQTIFAIERSDAFLLALSPMAIESDSFQNQLHLAQDAKKPIISLIVDAATNPAYLKQRLDDGPVVDMSQDFDDGLGTLVKWLEDGGIGKSDKIIAAETIGSEIIGQVLRLPDEEDIWSEDGYYWYKKWKSLTRIKAHLTNKRLIFFWDSRDAWKWNKKEWDQLQEAFPVALRISDIARVDEVHKPKKILIFTASTPFVEIVMSDERKHKITLQENFEERMMNLRQFVSDGST